jgi:hypothetical protein
VAIIIKAIKIKAVKENKAKEVTIKTKANIKVKDTAIKLKEEIIIALIISHYY